MTYLSEIRVFYVFSLLMPAAVAFGQNDLDLSEADARDSAYNYMAEAEKRYECTFEEHDMRAVGSRENEKYIFQVRSDGDECDEAMTYIVSLADREGLLIFRNLEGVDAPLDNTRFVPNQTLIHEINPEPGDTDATDDEADSENPPAG